MHGMLSVRVLSLAQDMVTRSQKEVEKKLCDSLRQSKEVADAFEVR